MADLPTVTGSVSKAQHAYQWLRRRISDGSFTPGHRLVLDQISKELNVSVVPVREAIRRLEAEGLVTFERNVGAQVAMIDAAAYQNAMQTLAVVEGFATALSAPVVTAEMIARARGANEQMINCLDNLDPHRFTQLNLEFHSVLFERCPNADVLDLVHRGWDRLSGLRDSTFSFVPGRARESVEEHENLLVLIEHGAPALEIELAARHHRLATLDAFVSRQAARDQG